MKSISQQENLVGKRTFQSEVQLVREALVREIRDATRWVAVVEAWETLLKVIRMAKSLQEERNKFSGTGNATPNTKSV